MLVKEMPEELRQSMTRCNNLFTIHQLDNNGFNAFLDVILYLKPRFPVKLNRAHLKKLALVRCFDCSNRESFDFQNRNMSNTTSTIWMSLAVILGQVKKIELLPIQHNQHIGKQFQVDRYGFWLLGVPPLLECLFHLSSYSRQNSLEGPGLPRIHQTIGGSLQALKVGPQIFMV